MGHDAVGHDAAVNDGAQTMLLTGTLSHCGVPLTFVGDSTRWSGILELRLTRLECGACGAEVRVDERIPVGPPNRVEEWRDRATRKACTLTAPTTPAPGGPS